jgi:hypothetical protein
LNESSATKVKYHVTARRARRKNRFAEFAPLSYDFSTCLGFNLTRATAAGENNDDFRGQFVT